MDTTSDEPKVNGKAGDKPNLLVLNNPEKSKEAKKKTKSANSSAVKRLPMPEIERVIHSLINCRKLAKEFTVWIPEVGEPQILEFVSTAKTVRLSSEEKLASVIVKNLSGDYAVTFSEAKAIAKRWKWDCGHKLESWPIPVSFKSTDSICFSRLNFDPAETYSSVDFPVILEMLERMGNWKAFCSAIGACFSLEASRKQAIWLFGDTNCGKSFLLNHVVAKICGGNIGTATFSGESLKGAHWKEPLLGKSLLVVNEASAAFIRSDAFKSLTGDDLHMINPKGLKMFQGRLDCRVFFSSNEAPEIPNDNALKERLIVCKMQEFGGKKLAPRTLETKIEAELPFFIAMCIALFKQTEGEIVSDTTELNNAVADFEEEIQTLFDNALILDSSSHVTSNQLINHLDRSLKTAGISLQRFRQFIKDRYGIIAVQSRDFGAPGTRGYRGIRLRLETMAIKV